MFYYCNSFLLPCQFHAQDHYIEMNSERYIKLNAFYIQTGVHFTEALLCGYIFHIYSMITLKFIIGLFILSQSS